MAHLQDLLTYLLLASDESVMVNGSDSVRWQNTEVAEYPGDVSEMWSMLPELHRWTWWKPRLGAEGSVDWAPLAEPTGRYHCTVQWNVPWWGSLTSSHFGYISDNLQTEKMKIQPDNTNNARTWTELNSIESRRCIVVVMLICPSW